MEATKNLREFAITRLIKFSGYSAIIFVGMIFIFLIKEGIPAFSEVPISTLIADRWKRQRE